ncbi:MAG: PQQ-like beta-propeller repeat protein [Vicinamibacteria bacterium]|nr:PQQ-like beta-propeller repeat protein [Vicinamibacteria bacterium]
MALDSTTGKKLWSHKPKVHRRSSPAFVLPDRVGVVDTSAGEAEAEQPDETLIFDAQTGRPVRRYPWAGSLVVGDMCVADASSVASLTSGEKLWEIGTEPGERLCRPFSRDRVWASEDLLVWGQKGGAVRCVRTRTGELVWETSVADIWLRGATASQKIPGEVSGRIQCFGRVVTFPTATHVVGVSLDTGKRLWAVEAVPLRGGGRCGDRLYVSYCAWIDPQSGKYHGEPAGRLVGPAKLERPREWKSKKDTFSGDFLVSETHIFGTSTAGTLEAWDRETGKHEWHEKPEGAKGYVELAPMVAAYGRLYYVDYSFRTYCYEEQGPGERSPKAAIAWPPRPAPSLATSSERRSSRSPDLDSPHSE